MIVDMSIIDGDNNWLDDYLLTEIIDTNNYRRKQELLAILIIYGNMLTWIIIDGNTQ